MSVRFKKLKPNRIFQGVVDQIQEAILDGELRAGDLLPAEMKLKEMFHTSRGTIREALRVLEQKGLIEIKTGVGGGAVVKAINTEKITESLDLLVQYQKVTLEHLAEFREGVEGIVTGLAAERATAGDVRRLNQLLHQARRLLDAAEPDAEAFVGVDTQLHIALAEIAGNPVYLANLHMVHEGILGNFERFSLRRTEVLQENYRDLCEIVAAVANGEANKARALAQAHVSRFSRYLQEDARSRSKPA
jgi:DNA-binding FadR family transcriptional regulator